MYVRVTRCVDGSTTGGRPPEEPTNAVKWRQLLHTENALVQATDRICDHAPVLARIYFEHPDA